MTKLRNAIAEKIINWIDYSRRLKYTSLFKSKIQFSKAGESIAEFDVKPNLSSVSLEKISPQDGRWHYIPPPLECKKVYVQKYDLAYIVGWGCLGLSKEGEVIKDTIFRTDERIDNAVSKDLSAIKQINDTKSNVKFIPGQAVILASRWQNYGHWITEHLPKIVYIKKTVENVSRITFIVSDPFASWKASTLDALGIKKEQILIKTKSEILQAEYLLVVDYPQPDRNCYSAITDAFLKEIPWGESYIYAKRGEKWGRLNVRNAFAVEDALKKMGFIIVEPDQYSIFDQAKIFRNAKIVVGLNGSAISNIIHMHEGNAVVEFFGRRVHGGFRQIAEEKGVLHFPIFMDIAGETTKSRRRKSLDMGSVDIPSLTHLILQIRKKQASCNGC